MYKVRDRNTKLTDTDIYSIYPCIFRCYPVYLLVCAWIWQPYP